MNTILMAALALAIVVGGCVLVLVAVAGMVWLFSKIDHMVGESAVDTILNVFLAVLMGGVFLAAWFASFYWLMGWS